MRRAKAQLILKKPYKLANIQNKGIEILRFAEQCAYSNTACFEKYTRRLDFKNSDSQSSVPVTGRLDFKQFRLEEDQTMIAHHIDIIIIITLYSMFSQLFALMYYLIQNKKRATLCFSIKYFRYNVRVWKLLDWQRWHCKDM